MGRGKMTGRGLGFCAGNDAPGCAFGRGFGRGRGFGMGFGRGVTPVPVRPVELSKEEQIKVLEGQKDSIEQELKSLKDKLEQLRK
jgi:hypothetical protein